MTQSLTIHISKFLKQYCSGKEPLLLALSGGPDSLALLHLLLHHRRKEPSFSFAVAHIDHGWRQESAQEAAILENKVLALSVPFHLKTLSPGSIEGNLEAACREERLRFFAELCAQHSYQGVLLSHHADDVAETVLKRVFEGASLSYLAGMHPETENYGIKLWRPFLAIRKHQIESWLHSQGDKGFCDSTNLDPKFMRGRLRTRILPDLNREFGKDVTTALCHLGEASAELRDYLDARIAPFMARVEVGASGASLDLSKNSPEAKLEIRYLIRRFCETYAVPLSRDALHLATEIFMEGSSKKSICLSKDLYLSIHRFCLTIGLVA